MNKGIVYGFITVTFILTVVGMIILPETLVTTMNFQGEASFTMNKYLALGLIYILNIFVSYQALQQIGKDQAKAIVPLVVMVLIYVLVFVFNV